MTINYPLATLQYVAKTQILKSLKAGNIPATITTQTLRTAYKDKTLIQRTYTLTMEVQDDITPIDLINIGELITYSVNIYNKIGDAE